MNSSRRAFLAVTASAAIAAPAVVRGRNLNSKLNYAGIGVDGKGMSDVIEMTNHKQVHPVAYCDVDLNRTVKARKKHPHAKIFQDYREMFAQLGDRIDAVTVSTPDHTHAIISLDAMALGKHVYCQKPLTRTVWEARQMRLAAKKSGVITRMGNQIHSHGVYRTAVQFFQSAPWARRRRCIPGSPPPGRGAVASTNARTGTILCLRPWTGTSGSVAPRCGPSRV